MDAGDTVEWFAASFPGAAPASEIDGIRVLRAGHQWTVHLEAFRRYRGRLRGRFDVVIDEVNTVPFFTPQWAGIPSALLIFQLAREVWWYESPFPLNLAGYVLEPWYLRAYRGTPAFTISASTRADLRRFKLRSTITVVPIGIEPIAEPDQAKAVVPTFLYAGRLAPSKRVHEILKAFAEFCHGRPPGRLWLIGDGAGAYLRRLRRLASTLGIEDSVDFLGRLPAEAKHQRMGQAHALLMASAREGWGLVVTEAGACGTPAIAYDVPGLRDSIRDGETGLLTRPDPLRLAAAMRTVIDDEPLRRRLSDGAKEWSRSFSYDRTARIFRDGIVAGLQ